MDEMNEVVEVNEVVETTQEVAAVVAENEVADEVTGTAKYTLTGIESIDNLIAEYNKQQKLFVEVEGKDNEYKQIILDGITVKINTLEATIDKEISKLSSLKSTALNAKSQEAITLLNELIDGYDELNDILTSMFVIDNDCNGIIMKLGLDSKFVIAGKTIKSKSGKVTTQMNYTERYELNELTKYDVHKTNRDGSVLRAGYCYVGTDNRIIWDSVNGSQYTSPTKFWAEVAGQNAGIHSLNHKCFTLIGAIELETITDDEGNIIKTGFNDLWDKLTK